VIISCAEKGDDRLIGVLLEEAQEAAREAAAKFPRATAPIQSTMWQGG
jgi:hypothetical protein